MKALLRRQGVFVKISMCLLILISLFILGCRESKVGESTVQTNLKSIELVRDPHFQDGFYLLSPVDGSKVYVDTLDFGNDNASPVWDLAQWYSNYDLAGFKPKHFPPDGIGYENEGKSVIIGASESEHADLALAVNSGVEFGFEPMQPGDGWPHLLVGQEFLRDSSLRIANLAEVIFTVKARLLNVKYYDNQPEGARRRAASYLAYIRIQNLNRSSKGYGDWYPFGVPIYDTRHLFVPAFARQDVGGGDKVATGKYIYRPSSEELGIKGSLHSGEWVEIRVDILPFILKGLEDAWNKGFLKDSQDLNDYFVSSISMGWEVWGLVDISIQLRDFSIIAKYYKE